MEACIRSRSNTPCYSAKKQAYQTTYEREFLLKRTPLTDEGIPLSQRFLLGSPFELNDAVGESLYAIDFTKHNKVQREYYFPPSTKRANRPHPHKEFPFWPRRSQSICDQPSEETKQVFRNQLGSTYQVDYVGAPQGFDLPLAFHRARPFWRDRAQHTLDSEYRNAYQNHPTNALHTGGRYSFSCRKPADAIVPQTVSVWKDRSARSIYGSEICGKTPSEHYIKEFVDSFTGPMN